MRIKYRILIISILIILTLILASISQSCLNPDRDRKVEQCEVNQLPYRSLIRFASLLIGLYAIFYGGVLLSDILDILEKDRDKDKHINGKLPLDILPKLFFYIKS